MLARLLSGRTVSSVAMLCFFGLACASPPPAPLELERGPEAEITADGLHRAKNPVLGAVWVKSDADFSSYDKIMIDVISVSYKRKPKSTRYDRTGSNFALTDDQMSRFQRYLREAFEEAVSKGESYGLVREPDAKTLRLGVRIIDLIVQVPTEQSAGRNRTFSASTGTMTLILELFDSLSGEILARAADRREARAAGGSTVSSVHYSTSVSNTANVRRLFKKWAAVLSDRLDQIHDIEPSRALVE